MLCDKHRVQLRHVRKGGKLVLACPYSHKKHREETGSSMRHCNTCGANYPKTAYHVCP